MYENLAILGMFTFIYSVVSGRLEKTPINGALVFTLFGLAVGPLSLNLLIGGIEYEGLGRFAELTLALLLFTDAAHANLGVLKKFSGIPGRMLVFGLPLTILLGFGAGLVLLPDLSLIEIALLATILAPTDAALGKPVVTNEVVPERIRESLNFESGLNDGICVPILLLFLVLATSGAEEEKTTVLALTFLAEEIGIGSLVGISLSLIGWLLLKLFGQKGWVTETWLQLSVPALAVSCFGLAQAVKGSGFIACFVGGLIFGMLVDKNNKHKLLLAAEGTGDTLALITWVIFGAAVVGRSIDALTWQVMLYSLLSLTVIRIIPIVLSLSRMNILIEEKLFLGWFGPRGLASIVFTVLVLNENLPGSETIVVTVVCTIILSVICHGISANPLALLLGRRAQRSHGKREQE